MQAGEAAIEAAITLVHRPEGSPSDAFCAGVASCRAELARTAGAVRLMLADVDQAPLLGRDVHETRPGAFAAAVVREGCTAANPHAAKALASLGPCASYRVRVRPVLDYERSWPDGARTPGVTMVAPVFRAAALSHEQFDVHWGDRHAPLALRHHVGMWRYVQYPVIEVLSEGAPAYDGIAFLYFRTLEDFTERLFDSDDGRRHIRDDTRRFLALDRSAAALMSETVLRGAG